MFLYVYFVGNIRIFWTGKHMQWCMYITNYIWVKVVLERDQTDMHLTSYLVSYFVPREREIETSLKVFSWLKETESEISTAQAKRVHLMRYVLSPNSSFHHEDESFQKRFQFSNHFRTRWSEILFIFNEKNTIPRKTCLMGHHSWCIYTCTCIYKPFSKNCPDNLVHWDSHLIICKY